MGGESTDWSQYLDRLELAIRTLDDQLTDRAAPSFPRLQRPFGSLPVELQDRTRGVLQLAEQVSERTRQQLDELAAQVQHLPRRLSPPDRRFAVSRLDVIG